MRRLIIASTTALMLTVTSACQQQEEPDAPDGAVPAETAAPTFRDNPDFGGVEAVTVEAEGVGPTPNIAALRGLDQAIAQVNGRRVSSSSAALSAGVDIRVDGLGSLGVDSDAYADVVVSSSDGAVRSFSVVSSEEIERVDYEREFNAAASLGGWFGDKLEVSETERGMSRYWKVRVKAEVAKFVGPKDDGRPSIAITAPRVGSARYQVGDGHIDASSVAAEIRGRLSDALTQTDRFQVLDREFGDELQDEVDFINSGNARKEEVARLGQRLATDLILVPTIERFAYPRSSRKLRMSDRELVSYAGGGRISLRLINATTGEVVLSETFSHELPATGASTLPRSIDGVGLATEMMSSLSGQMTKTIVAEIFPVSVIALMGDQVVLSQGGQSLAVGERYEAVVLGQELSDPQTGRSLGRMEIPCCVIMVDRVAGQTSYGTIEGNVPASLSSFSPGMVELRGLAKAATSAPESPPAVADAAAAPMRRASSSPVAQPTVPAAQEDSDW
ncbi:CsgG/HfaB family protein [Novilysobacter spongiicola]|uniref:Curli production assembly/transport component CsgG n=1 Tax=Lysobacter spongiicola DSM 21749 TaxID=1122188 RepID=A0A1T4NBH4_9GAMM|nr:CsgG/HfaB family protein [Lysobacter spongiicola]SJZ76640.1 Curli production assembly/transport component CsgG [Lysobacter spongiicola DSM 21749]